MRTHERTAARLAVLALGTLCAFAAGAADELPEPRDWIEVRTEHFTLYSEERPGTTRELAANLERFRDLLGALTAGFRHDADVPTVVYVFRRTSSFAPYNRRADGTLDAAVGYFREGPYRNFVALDASDSGNPLRIVQHEHVHALLHRTFSDLPVWLDEGLAEYYGAIEIRQSKYVEIGRPILGHRALLAREGLGSFAELFATTRSSPAYDEGARRGRFYAQAWLLVHWLFDDADRRKKLDAILTALANGVEPDRAVAEGLGPDPESLSKSLRAHLAVAGDRIATYALREVAEIGVGEPREMSPGEVLYVLGALLASGEDHELPAARAHLEAAAARGGPATRIATARAAVAEREGHLDAAAESYRRAADAQDTDAEALARYAYFLVQPYFDGRKVADTSDEVPAEWLEARRLFERSLELDPDGAEALAGLGKTYLHGREGAAEGLMALSRAHAIHPYRDDVLHDLICILAKGGRTQHAWKLLETELRRKARGREIVASAERFVARWDLRAAQERFGAGDRPGALAILDGVLPRVQDATLRGEIEAARVQLATIPEGTELVELGHGEDPGAVERFNAVASLSNAGRYDEALALARQTLATLGDSAMRARLEAVVADLDRLTRHNALVTRFNGAVTAANAGRRQEAIDLLLALREEVDDADLSRAILDLLRQLGVSPKPGT